MRSAVLVMCAIGKLLLPELNEHSLGMGARSALESPFVVVKLVGRFDAREKHWQPADRTSFLLDWALARVKAIPLQHNTLLLTELSSVGASFSLHPESHVHQEVDTAHSQCRLLENTSRQESFA